MIESNNLKLGSKTVSSKSKPYIIAEIGVNHGGSIDLALELIDQAKKGGADAVKFQSYKADTLASIHSPAYWDTSKESTLSQHQLFKKYDNFNAKDYQLLSKYCKKNNIEFLSTPFDDEAIEFLDPLVSFFKIASADITNLPFLKKIASKGKPIIISTGMSTLIEIDIAVKSFNSDLLSILHCTSSYPCSNDEINLNMLNTLKKLYPNNLIGYSGHESGLQISVAAVAMGAKIIERHITLDRTMWGSDQAASVEPEGLKKLVRDIRVVESALGDGKKVIYESEKSSREKLRRFK